jgi:hypothetical protein
VGECKELGVAVAAVMTWFTLASHAAWAVARVHRRRPRRNPLCQHRTPPADIVVIGNNFFGNCRTIYVYLYTED